MQRHDREVSRKRERERVKIVEAEKKKKKHKVFQMTGKKIKGWGQRTLVGNNQTKVCIKPNSVTDFSAIKRTFVPFVALSLSLFCLFEIIPSSQWRSSNRRDWLALLLLTYSLPLVLELFFQDVSLEFDPILGPENKKEPVTSICIGIQEEKKKKDQTLGRTRRRLWRCACSIFQREAQEVEEEGVRRTTFIPSIKEKHGMHDSYEANNSWCKSQETFLLQDKHREKHKKHVKTLFWTQRTRREKTREKQRTTTVCSRRWTPCDWRESLRDESRGIQRDEEERGSETREEKGERRKEQAMMSSN